MADRVETLVFGARGLLGRSLVEALGERAAGLDLPQCDVTNEAMTREWMDRLRPEVVVNCAAYTNVDEAETHRSLAEKLNVDAVRSLAEICRERNVLLFTFSTDYVFHGRGTGPFPEDASPEHFGPLSVYAETKLRGEEVVREVGGRWCIVRTQWLYGHGGRNFIDAIADLVNQKDRLRVVSDQIGAATYAVDLARSIRLLIDRRATGFYHCVNSGFASRFEIACHIADRLKASVEMVPCSTEEFPRPAERPLNSRMDQRKFAALAGKPMRHWREALDDYLGIEYGSITPDGTNG